jgi:hypothetical protein
MRYYIALIYLFCLCPMMVSAQMSVRYLPKTKPKVSLPTSVIWMQPSTLSTQSMMFVQTYSIQQLPFFCKIEAKLEKKIHLPIKFRLGEVEYVDWLEGKHSSYSIPKN